MESSFFEAVMLPAGKGRAYICGGRVFKQVVMVFCSIVQTSIFIRSMVEAFWDDNNEQYVTASGLKKRPVNHRLSSSGRQRAGS